MEENKEIIIKDPLLYPYYVRVEESQYVLMRDEKKKINPIIGYYRNLDQLFLDIIMKKIVQFGPKKIYNIREYLLEYKKMLEDFSILFKQILSENVFSK